MRNVIQYKGYDIYLMMGRFHCPNLTGEHSFLHLRFLKKIIDRRVETV